MSNNEAVTEEIAGAAYIENFAVKVFTQADNADRAGKATRYGRSINFVNELTIV